MSNYKILTKKFETQYATPPFEEIKEEYFLPAFQELIAQAEKEIEEITQNPEKPNFENTIEALAYSGLQLNILSQIFFNLNSAETNENIQKIAQEISPILTVFSSKIFQNNILFSRVKKVYDDQKGYSLSTEQKTLLEDTYKGFVRNGALLNENDKKELEKIHMELAQKTLQFGENVLGATNSYYKHILNKEELAGIPESIIEQYEEEAKSRNLQGYVITLQFPSYYPVITYGENRKLREEIALANGKKAFDDGEFDNKKLIIEITELRHKKAKLLGYENYADFVLEERMAGSTEKVVEFLNELLQKAKPYALKEIEELKNIALKEGINDLKSFDHAYFAEKLKKQKLDLNDEDIKPYFSLENVEKAVFDLSERLFGLTFEETNSIQKYHPEVKTYKVFENTNPEINEKQLKAILYVDYYPRKGKRAGAWMTCFRNQYKKNGENHRPHISIVCNFTKPSSQTPSLLTFQEVTTLFHEFGHAIHGMLANTQYPNLSGTSVKWDFVELPSQFLENYCYEPEFLKTFAKHYQTQDILSDDKIKKLSASKNFMEGYQTLRQIGFGLLDIAYHTQIENLKNLGIKYFEEQTTKETQLYPTNPETAISTSFSHIFQGGYAAGYYSYKWAEVLDADAFQYFKENGIFNQNIAIKYKQLLSAGGTQDPMKLYENFRGRLPQVDSLLNRAFGK